MTLGMAMTFQRARPKAWSAKEITDKLDLIKIKNVLWNLEGHNELLGRTDTDSQTLKNLQFPNETGWG